MLGITLALTACGDSDGTPAGTSAGPGTGASVFEDSDFVTERYGVLTQRDLAPDASPAAVGQLAASFNAFSLEAHRALAAASPADNAIVSGYSLANALSLTLSGTANETRSALATLLHLDTLAPESLDAAVNALSLEIASRANEDLEVRSANRLFVADGQSLNDAFLDNAVANYGAPVTSADFLRHGPEVVEAINGWVSDETNGLIETLLDKVEPDTLVAVLNATLLDAVWSDPFEAAGDQAFTTLADETRQLPFFGFNGNLPAMQEAGLTAVAMPYAGNGISMLVVLPDDLAAFEASLTTSEIDRLAGMLNGTEVSYSLPEWDFEQEIDGKALLEPLGLPVGEYDFSAMLADVRTTLTIGEIKQKARIEVDKDGTRAAAATAVTVAPTSAPAEPPLEIRIDRPFWYAIRDDATGLLLFSGRVVNPG